MKYLTPVDGERPLESRNFVPHTDAFRAAIRRHRWKMLLVTAAIGSLAAIMSLRMPKIYEAIATLEYDPNPATPLGSSVEDTNGPVNQFLMSREFFDTQNLIIQSRAVAERVVQRLGLSESASFVPADSPNPTLDAAQRIQNMLTVDPVKDTRLIKLKVRDTDPERAAALANGVAEAYISKTMDDRLGSTVDASNWLTEQLETARQNLNRSEHALHEFKKKHDVLSVSLENRQDLLAEEMHGYNVRLTEAKAKRIELQARVERLRTIQKNPTTSRGGNGGEKSKNDGNTVLGDLRSQLRSNLSERALQSVRYGDAHPKIREIDRTIETIRGEIDKEMRAMIKSAQGDLEEVRAVERGLQKALGSSQKQGLVVNLREIEYSKLARQRESNSKLYDLLLQRTAETDLTGGLRTTHVRMVDSALVPESAVSPRMILNVVAGLFLGFLLAILLALGLEQIDRRIRGAADVEALGTTLLGVFPKIAGNESSNGTPGKSPKTAALAPADMERIVHTHPQSIAAESCRTVRTNLMFMSAENPLQSLVVASANPRDGKTTVASNLAIAFAQSGQKVLLIDADLRRPRLHKAFEMANGQGLTTTLIGEQSLSDVTRSTEVEGLSVITSGPIPPNPSELLHTARFRKLLEEAKSRYDRVVFDSPPLRAVTDAAILATQCAGVVLVVRADNTTRDAVAGALRSLVDVQANIVGCVLNDVDPSKDSYGYGGYYHYYRSDEYRTDDNAEESNVSAA